MLTAMHALKLDAGRLRLDRDAPRPEPAKGEALVRLLLAGICNTDLELARGYMDFSGIPGHEFVGVVEEADDNSDLIGQRVVGEINAACGDCPACARGDVTHCAHRDVLGILGRDGAFADHFTLPLRNLLPVPAGVTDEQAVFAEPLAAALEITQQVFIRPADKVVVIGDGKLGLLIALALRLTGCDLLLAGRHDGKLAIARAQGIPTVLEADAPNDLQADVAVDATGQPGGFALARRLLRPRGTLVLKSTFKGETAVDLTRIVVDEISLVGSRCGPFAPALRLLASGDIDPTPLIEAEYPLDQGAAAFDHAARRGALKILLRPTGDRS